MTSQQKHSVSHLSASNKGELVNQNAAYKIIAFECFFTTHRERLECSDYSPIHRYNAIFDTIQSKLVYM